MVEEKGTSKRFGSLWKSLRASIYRDRDRAALGILAFEVSKLMSKIINLWKCLSDREIARLREEIANSYGLRKLVSGDENYLMNLVLAEIIENVVSVVKSVIRLGKKCTDPTYHHLDRVFGDFNEIDPKWYGLRYKLKKMEKKIKKMETFVAATEQLYHEVEVLAELDQSLRRMQGGSSGTSQVKLLEFQQKVVLQRRQVKNLREMSPWVRRYDYIVQFFIRSLFTIIERIKIVDGTYLTKYSEGSDNFEIQEQSDCLINRSDSISALMQASVYPLEDNSSRFKFHLGKSLSNLSLKFDHRSNSKNVKSHMRSQSFVFCGKQQYSPRARDEAYVVESFSKVLKNTSVTDPIPKNTKTSAYVSSSIDSKHLMLNPPTSTLGYAALALHYANIIVLIEKLALSSPHKISLDTRIDLYNMLPSTIRSSLRSKLKVFSRNQDSSVHDLEKWSLELERTLEWLSPLAHNMIRWQSERNFERHRSTILGSNVLLVQTLYFASQAETESAIVELLKGLNCTYRFARENNQHML